MTDDAAQGRGASLAASLDYGFTQAFTDAERAILALLALFQGFTDIDVLRAMGTGDDPVPAVAGLTREAGIALLDRAAEVGLLTAYGDGYYAVHPAIPWHLHTLFQQHYGPDGSPPADHAIRAWTTATSDLGDYYLRQYEQGHTGVTGVLGAEEANLLHARRLALTHHWHDQVIGAHARPARPLRPHRAGHRMAAAGRRADPRVHRPRHRRPPPRPRRAMGPPHRLPGPHRPGRPRLARRPAAPSTPSSPGGASRPPPPSPSPPANSTTASATRSAASRWPCTTSARSCGNKTIPAACSPTRKPWSLFSGSATGAREATVAFNLGHAYKDIPALRDLDQAEHWYQRYLQLLEEHDTLGRARGTGQLGNIAYERFKDARAAGAPGEQLLRHLNDAAGAYHQALGLLPDNAVDELAVTHHALGMIYGDDQGHRYCPRALPAGHRLTASARTTATAPAGPGTTPPSPSPTPGAVTTRCSTPAPPCATSRPSAPAPPPGPARHASSSPSWNKSQHMNKTPRPVIPPEPTLPCPRTGQDTWTAVAAVPAARLKESILTRAGSTACR